MNAFFTCLLAFLELNFVFIVLALLHSQRRRIGNTPFYLSIGVIFLLTQFVSGAGLVLTWNIRGFGEVGFPIGATVLFTPYLAILLLVYITEGVLVMQRLVVGMMVILGIFLYLGGLTAMQSGWSGYFANSGLSGEALRQLLTESRRAMLSMVVVQIVDMFTLPICFTWLRHSKCRLFACFLGTLVGVLTLDAVMYQLLMGLPLVTEAMIFNSTVIVRLLSAVWVCLLLTVYVVKMELPEYLHDLPKSNFEIIFAFFGGYGRSKALEKNLLESEWRYRNVINTTSEMVIMLDSAGRVAEANPAAIDFFGMEMQDIYGVDFRKLAAGATAEDEGLLENITFKKNDTKLRIIRNSDSGRKNETKKGQLRTASLAVNHVLLKGSMMHVVIGQDITASLQAERDREELFEQLSHAQRMEAIGQLAGGVAHDFNNHIHAILGNVDVLSLKVDSLPEDVSVRLDKIAAIAEQAGQLTGQLLGFARKGKYRETEIDLKDLLERSLKIFYGGHECDIVLNKEIAADREMLVRGDFVQLSQVLINLLINARDALAGCEEPQITVTIGEAVDVPAGFIPQYKINGAAPNDLQPEDYWHLSVRDNGCGMSEDVLKHIFEPFYTTKPVGKGTGMGLAMSYGTVRNHQGWLQVKSTTGQGTVFSIILPKTVKKVVFTKKENSHGQTFCN